MVWRTHWRTSEGIRPSSVLFNFWRCYIFFSDSKKLDFNRTSPPHSSTVLVLLSEVFRDSKSRHFLVSHPFDTFFLRNVPGTEWCKILLRRPRHVGSLRFQTMQNNHGNNNTVRSPRFASWFGGNLIKLNRKEMLRPSSSPGYASTYNELLQLSRCTLFAKNAVYHNVVYPPANTQSAGNSPTALGFLPRPSINYGTRRGWVVVGK